MVYSLAFVAVTSLLKISDTVMVSAKRGPLRASTFENGDRILSDAEKNNLLKIDIPLFSSEMTKPYSSVEEARNDLEKMARYMASKFILDEISNQFYYSRGYHEDALASNMIAEAAPPPAAEADAGGSSEAAFAGTNDFDTYQHEAGAIKNDHVKSNGIYVFAAVDDRVLVWNLGGDLLETIVMPPIAYNSGRDSAYGYWKPKPYIQALLMNPEGSKLAVVVDGYGIEHQSTDQIKVEMGNEIPVIYSYLETRIIVYDIVGSNITEVSRSDINGYHVDSYMIGNNVHLVTRMNLNTWDNFEGDLGRRLFPDLSDDDYIIEATLKAEEIIPEFVDKVVDLFTDNAGNIILSRLTIFADSISDSSHTKLYDLFSGGIANSITQVNSFDIDKVNSNSTEQAISKSATIQPGSWGYVYATDQWMWVTEQGWTWVQEEKKYAQNTMLLGFKLDGPSSTLAAVGSIPGSLLSQFSIDFVKDNEIDKEYLRIATTQIFFRGGWIEPRPIPLTTFDANNTEAEQDIEEESRTLNQVIIFEVPKIEGDKILGSNELIQLGSVNVGKKHETITAVRFFDNVSYIVTFEQTDPFYVLDLSNPMEPTILGELEIPGFSEFMHPITEDKSMLITVGKDADEEGNIIGLMISIFDATKPDEPKLVDRLVVEDDKETWSGSSAAWDERAFRYIQVGTLGRLIIPVSIYSYRWGVSDHGEGVDFEGFMVFGVDLTKSELMITKEFEVDHSRNQGEFAWVNSRTSCFPYWLPQRSMVFDGDLLTLRNQQVISTNLVSHQTQWDMILENKESEDGCYDIVLDDVISGTSTPSMFINAPSSSTGVEYTMKSAEINTTGNGVPATINSDVTKLDKGDNADDSPTTNIGLLTDYDEFMTSASHAISFQTGVIIFTFGLFCVPGIVLLLY